MQRQTCLKGSWTIRRVYICLKNGVTISLKLQNALNRKNIFLFYSIFENKSSKIFLNSKLKSRSLKQTFINCGINKYHVQNYNTLDNFRYCERETCWRVCQNALRLDFWNITYFSTFTLKNFIGIKIIEINTL